jgi:hypothetical protein
MLFTPWRNERTDLMGNCSSFQEHYIARYDDIARYDEIGEQMRQYAVCVEDLNEIQHHLQECISVNTLSTRSLVFILALSALKQDNQ